MREHPAQVCETSDGLFDCRQDAQAGRNVIECLLLYLDRGGHWTAGSGFRNVALAIIRKVNQLA